MANRGALGGLSEAALQAALLLDAAGRQDVFVETVGVGQAEIDIIDHADTIVLVLMPGSGDSIQALKAGVMEIPDVIAINKADHPLTDTMVREIRGVLSLANLDRTEEEVKQRWRVPIVKTEATHGTGVEELVDRLREHREHILAAGQLEERRRATCTTRCSRSPPRGCAGAWRRSWTRTMVQAPLGGSGRAPVGPGERRDNAAGAHSGALALVVTRGREGRGSSAGRYAAMRYAGLRNLVVPMVSAPAVSAYTSFSSNHCARNGSLIQASPRRRPINSAFSKAPKARWTLDPPGSA